MADLILSNTFHVPPFNADYEISARTQIRITQEGLSSLCGLREQGICHFCKKLQQLRLTVDKAF
jgi:hypothetical protein